MQQDMLGLTLTTQSAAAARAFDHAVNGYLTYRADGMQRLGALLQADAEFGLAHVLKGYFAMLAYKQAAVPMAQQAAADAAPLLAHATPREQAHLAALQAWIRQDTDHAAAIWEQIVRDHPLDVVAFRLAHFVNFWLGRPGVMLASVQAVLPHWSDDLPGYNAILGCLCFANEECGHYVEAEEAGRAAIAREPGDLWAAHGVAHVMEMQGRRGEGLLWLEPLAPHWEGSNNLSHHLWWHAAMFELEHGDHRAVLARYDRHFRNLASPLVEAAPDLYIDVQNACSMLWRLARQGVDVGDRWTELADKVEARIDDCLSAFTLPHWMMALAATGRFDAAQRLLVAMRDFAQGPGRVRGAGRQRCAAGDRGGAAARAGRTCAGGGGDAAGARRDASARWQPRAAGRAGASVSRRGDAGRVAGRCASAAGTRRRPPSGAAVAPRRLCGAGARGGVLNRRTSGKMPRSTLPLREGVGGGVRRAGRRVEPPPQPTPGGSA